MSKEIYLKLDTDDILEIILEYYQEQIKGESYAKGMFLGSIESNDLRIVATITNDFEKYNDVNLEEIDNLIDYNGNHAFIKRNPDFNINSKNSSLK